MQGAPVSARRPSPTRGCVGLGAARSQKSACLSSSSPPAPLPCWRSRPSASADLCASLEYTCPEWTRDSNPRPPYFPPLSEGVCGGLLCIGCLGYFSSPRLRDFGQFTADVVGLSNFGASAVILVGRKLRGAIYVTRLGV